MLSNDHSNSDSSHSFIQGIEELTKRDRDLAKIITFSSNLSMIAFLVEIMAIAN